LVRGDSGYIAIDAGSDKRQAEVGLYELGILLQDIFAIFLTHGDSDHIAAISLFPNATLDLSENEVQMIDGKAYSPFNISAANFFPISCACSGVTSSGAKDCIKCRPIVFPPALV